MTNNLKIELEETFEAGSPEDVSPEECEREYWRIFGIKPDFDEPVPEPEGEEMDNLPRQ